MTTRNLSVRLSLKDADKVKQGLRSLGEDGQKALERIERSAQPASAGLLALNAVMGDAETSVLTYASNLGTLGRALTAVGTAGAVVAGLLGAIAAGTALAGVQAGNAARDFSDLVKEAERVGLNLEAFQELAYAARATGVDVEKLGEALKEMSGRALDAFQNGGEAAEGFARIGLSQTDLQQKLGDTDKLFTEVIERIGQLKTEGERILTVQQIFGDEGGEPLLALIGRGADEFARLREEAHEMGVVLSEDVVKQGAGAQRQLDLLTNVIDIHLNNAFVDLAPILVDTAQFFADIAAAVSAVVDSFRELELRSTRNLKLRLSEATASRDAAVARRTEVEAEKPTSGIAAAGQATRLSDINREIAERSAEVDKINAILAARETESRKPVAIPDPRPAPVALPRPARAGSGRSSPREDRPEREEQDRIGDYIAQLQEQAMLLRLEEDQRRRLEALLQGENIARQQGKALTADQRAEIDQLTLSMIAFEAESGIAAERQRELAETGREVGSVLTNGLRSAILSGDSLTQTLGNVARALADIALQKAVLDPIGDWFGGLLGGGGGGFGGSGGSGGGLGFFGSLLSGIGGFLSGGPRGAVAATNSSLHYASLYHEGGVAGSPGPGRFVSPSVFSGAPRYHDGGVAGIMPGEIPAILRKGETVFTPEQMAALQAPSVTSGDTTINIPVSVTVEAGARTDPSVAAETGKRVAAALRQELRSVIQQELLNERRPGGVLS